MSMVEKKNLKRIYVHKDFANSLKVEAIKVDLPVTKMTKDLSSKLKEFIEKNVKR